MNKHTVIVGLLCVGLAVSGQAQNLSVGAHGAYSVGGDVEESSIGFGAQLELAVSDAVSLEIAGTRFTDEASEDGGKIEQTLNSIGASLILRMPLDHAIEAYVLGGVNYNTTDYDVTLPPEFAGLRVNVDVDDQIGFHFGGGVRVALNENLTLFGEYRHTLLELEGTVEMPQLGVSETDKMDYNFGLIKAGLNLKF